jgi:hypothetical protein
VPNETLRDELHPSILIAHEDVLVRHVLSTGLLKAGHLVVTAVDDSEAKLLLHKFQQHIQLLIASEALSDCAAAASFAVGCLTITEETRKELATAARSTTTTSGACARVLDKVRTSLEHPSPDRDRI